MWCLASAPAVPPLCLARNQPNTGMVPRGFHRTRPAHPWGHAGLAAYCLRGPIRPAVVTSIPAKVKRAGPEATERIVVSTLLNMPIGALHDHRSHRGTSSSRDELKTGAWHNQELLPGSSSTARAEEQAAEPRYIDGNLPCTSARPQGTHSSHGKQPIDYMVRPHTKH